MKANICSEPLLCPIYNLPKDHKDGVVLKGRPIHAATDTPATQLSKYLAHALKPLLKHIPCHLRNTEEFIEFLSESREGVYGFCSLDVKNLYGPIPLEDLDDKTPSVFTVARNFFEAHKTDCRCMEVVLQRSSTCLR